jgi:hypothetical protein
VGAYKNLNRHPAYAVSYVVHAVENYISREGFTRISVNLRFRKLQTNRQDLVWGNLFKWDITIGIENRIDRNRWNRNMYRNDRKYVPIGQESDDESPIDPPFGIENRKSSECYKPTRTWYTHWKI